MRYSFHRGDTRPLRVTLRRVSGKAITLGDPGPNQSSVRFNLLGGVAGLPDLVDRPVVVLEGTVVPPTDLDNYDPANPAKEYGKGVVEYQWAALETDVAGIYRASFEIETVAGDTETVPNDGFLTIEID